MNNQQDRPQGQSREDGGTSNQAPVFSKPFTTSSASPAYQFPTPDTLPLPDPEALIKPSKRLPMDEEVPTDVCTKEQLVDLPQVCLSGNKERPLRHVDEDGTEYHYALRPMCYSVIFILVVELLERFAFYGINFTQTSYLIGGYSEEWNAGMTAVEASSNASTTIAVAYTAPFVGAYLADMLIGDYWSVLVGCIVFYIPGLLLIWLSAVPHFLGEEFNTTLLKLGLVVLWPLGTGIIKSAINVFGAKQFHPLLQSSMVETYYINFYLAINVGALVGGFIVPIVAQHDVAVAYFYPVAMLCLGVMLFVLGTPRYVQHKPAGNLCSTKRVPGGSPKHKNTVLAVFYISALVIPFSVVYSQMTTTFIVQGTAMKMAFGFLDAAGMNNVDCISVLFFGYVTGTHVYPALAKRGIKIPTTDKFAFGTALGGLAILWTVYVEHMIKHTYATTGERISVLWQTPAYMMIGFGEIFAMSAAYEAAFSAAPPDSKTLASAVNLFCIGGIPGVACIVLYNACASWFHNSHGTANISEVEDYVSAHVARYFWVMFGISVFGVIINLLPSVKVYIMNVEADAADMLRTPTILRRPMSKKRSSSECAPGEESPLLRAERHQMYLKFGTGPMLHKQSSMHAGPSFTDARDAAKPRKPVKKSVIDTLYNSTNNGSGKP